MRRNGERPSHAAAGAGGERVPSLSCNDIIRVPVRSRDGRSYSHLPDQSTPRRLQIYHQVQIKKLDMRFGI